MNKSIGISVIVYTKNEQLDLPGCLQSMSWSDDIHVYDSMSSDDTVAIAQQFGAHVTQRSYGDNKLPFGGNEAAHRNWAFENLPFKHEWVYHTDADERVTPELLEAMQKAVSKPNGCAAFRVQRRDYLMGTWLRHVTPSPFNIRLFKSSKVRYERLTNPVIVIDGPVGEIGEHFNHYPFSKGIRHWFDKHNSYSDFEAGQIMENRKNGKSFSWRSAFFARDRNERRAHQKELYYSMPCRPLAMFLLLYVVKRGFLDGKAGLTFVILRSIYEYMIVLKTNELSDKSRGAQ